jgi:hypothetical protein
MTNRRQDDYIKPVHWLSQTKQLIPEAYPPTAVSSVPEEQCRQRSSHYRQFALKH